MAVCPTLLIVDDEANTRKGLIHFLESLNYDVFTASDGEEGWKIYQKEKPDLVLADSRMPGLTGIQLLEKIKSFNPAALVILLTAYGSVEDAVKAMKSGAFYYLTKPVNLEELEFLIKKALASLTLEEENRELKQALFQEKFEKGEILGRSKKIKDVLKLADQAAPSHATVLIEGESGTGKELIAHRIHELSPRRNKPFVAVHCAALTETLLTSELFGHERGAFTGAVERKIGRFERAHEGTLFLDEIADISPDTQVKLLRVLQDGEFERVGGTKSIKVNVRLLLATNKNLIEEVKKGNFREDLYYRINVIYLKLPPLRERKEDIPLLAESFIRHFAWNNGKKIQGLEPDALQAFMNYSWPGNIRELRNIIERMVVLAVDDKLRLENVPEDIRNQNSPKGPEEKTVITASLSEMEKEYIRKALQEMLGNKSLAAKKLGISRRTLYRKIAEYGIPE